MTTAPSSSGSSFLCPLISNPASVYMHRHVIPKSHIPTYRNAKPDTPKIIIVITIIILTVIMEIVVVVVVLGIIIIVIIIILAQATRQLMAQVWLSEADLGLVMRFVNRPEVPR